MGDLKFHPACEIFPVMSGEELALLVEDIVAHGQREPITVTSTGLILDGRNRYLACRQAGVEPKIRRWDPSGEEEALRFCVSENVRRRHMTQSQIAAVMALAEKIVERVLAESAERELQGKNAEPRGPGGSAAVLASMAGVSRALMADALSLAKTDPTSLRSVASGEKTIIEVKKDRKEEERVLRRLENADAVREAPDLLSVGARFATIVLDPPWDLSEETGSGMPSCDRDLRGSINTPYATMTIDEIAAMPVGQLADVDCHIYLWITNRNLPNGFPLLERWGFRYVSCLTWCKPVFGLGVYFRGSTEHVLFGVKGSQFLLRKDVGTWFPAPRPPGHSQKPPEFFALVESCSPGPRLEMFARKPRPGWTVWGAEAEIPEGEKGRTV